MLEDLLAQQDVTSVPDPTQSRPEMGRVQNTIMSALVGADPTFGIATSMAGFTPDRSNLGVEIAAGFFAGPGLIKAAIRAPRAIGRGFTRLLDKAIEFGDRDVVNTLGGLLDPKTTKRLFGSKARRTTQEGVADQSLFDEIVLDRQVRESRSRGEALANDLISRGNPRMDLDAASPARIREQLGLPPSKNLTPLTRGDFNVSSNVDDAFSRLNEAGSGLLRETPQRRAINKARREISAVKDALDAGDNESARKLARQFIESERAPFRPGR